MSGLRLGAAHLLLRPALRPGFASSGCRKFSASGPACAAKPLIVAKSEADAEAVRTALDRLLSTSSPPTPSSSGDGAPARDGQSWSLTAAGDGIERAFRFKNFTKTWDFMTAVALQCKLRNHHPEWSNVYSTTFVRWTTHSPSRGLTRKDVELAALCDQLARDFGEVVPETAKEEATAASASASSACRLQGLADSAAGISGGDCCTPAKKV